MINFYLFKKNHNIFPSLPIWMLLGVLFSVSCSNAVRNTNIDRSFLKDSLIIIGADAPEIIDTIHISRFIDSLFYISLEKTNQCEISGVDKVFMTDSFIFVLDANSSLYSFDAKGIFLKKIAGGCWGFDVLEENRLLFVATARKIEVYNYFGEIVHPSIRLGTELEDIGNFFAAIDSNTIAVSIWNQGTEDNRLVIIDTDGSTVQTFPNFEKFKSSKFPLVNARRFHHSVSRYHNTVFYHPYYSDTLYSLSENRMNPIFVEKKIFKVPLEHRLEYVGDVKIFNDYCRDNEAYATRIFNSMRYILVIYNLGNITHTLPNYLLYDKVLKRTYNYRQKLRFDNKSLHFGFFNDYDGGLPFNPEDLSGEYLIETYQPSRFKNHYTVGRYIESCEGQKCTLKHFEIKSGFYNDPERKNTLDHFVSQIEENGNPILIVARLNSIDQN